MENKPQNFEELVKQVHTSKQALRITPKQILGYLEVKRRGWRVVEAVNNMFEKYEVFSEPDFGSAWAYGEMELKPKPKVPANNKNEGNNNDYDPTPRISLLRAANLAQLSETTGELGLISVGREEKLTVAVHLMMTHGYSQLPILSGRREVGIVSWRSIGRALALGKTCVTVSDCKEEVLALYEHTPLFYAVTQILEKGIVLVKRKDDTIIGIVTATDIGEQFITMAEPFLLIEQIEKHIRKILGSKFTIEQLKDVIDIDPQDSGKQVKALSDLNFGDYIRIISKPQNFEKLGLNIDRVMFVKQLDAIRDIRNDVMHFDPDGIDKKDIEILRQMVSFLSTINTVLKR